MKNNRVKLMALILAFTMLFAMGTTSFAQSGGLGSDVYDTFKDLGKTVTSVLMETVSKIISELFSDIKETDWFASTVKNLVDLGGINGYPDGSFKPNNTITNAEFTKVLTSALGFDNLTATSSHWGSGYVDKAVSLGLVTKTELSDMDKPITRKVMAKMAANALDYLKESQISDRAEFKSLITDFAKISASYQDYVLKAFTKGIITGYPDGTFGADRGLTRAEASTVIMRIIDPAIRQVPSKPVQTTETGPNADLNKVVLTSAAKVDVYGLSDTKNRDFQFMFKTWEPLNPQYNDAEKLLTSRFDADNKTVKEIMSYIKTKNNRDKELPYKEYKINGQLIVVMSSANSQNISLSVFR
ncbi:MAG: S-layer homology domain-containing protein [Gudongella sp.]|jgi:hypothetical protein|nr:S-layer homology domain-containing protein [Gudongella sp.]